MIQIIDYGRGNLNNVLKAFQKFGFSAKIIDNPDAIEQASGLVLPGVGAFGDSMTCLNNQGFSEAIRYHVASGKPLLGICLGLQLLFEESEEFGNNKGLEILKGRIVPFEIDEKVPHIGWNQIRIEKNTALFRGISSGSYFYFVHSYYAIPKNESTIIATTHYGLDFTSAIQEKNVYATQFHPEKSQKIGLEIIKNFGEVCVSYSCS